MHMPWRIWAWERNKQHLEERINELANNSIISFSFIAKTISSTSRLGRLSGGFSGGGGAFVRRSVLGGISHVPRGGKP